MYTIFRDIAYR